MTRRDAPSSPPARGWQGRRPGGAGSAASAGLPDHKRLLHLVDEVRCGRLPRRDFIARLAGFGVAAPLASLMLMDAGIAQTPVDAYKPTKRGGGGALKLLFWQGPTLLNPHFSSGTKDSEACRIFYEPLARWDADAKLVPILAADIPSRANGGLAADGKSVVWKIRKGVTWHDGVPLTADDLVFTAQYAADPETATFNAGNFAELKLEKVDSHTVRVVFDRPQPFWPGTYSLTGILPRHHFAAWLGAKSRDAPANLKPVGTGPYRFVEFRPGDLLRAELNPDYHMPLRPHFDSIEIKGGGDAVSAARAVLQTGEYDYAWNLLVEDEILKRLETGAKGRVAFTAGATVEFILLNATDPSTEVDGERASPKSRHPVFGDAAVRKAIGLLMDRQGIQKYIAGRTAAATPNILNSPAPYRSPNLKMEFSIDKANALLDAAGWARGADGVRAKDGRKLKFLFQTSINAPRQKVQALVKQAAQKAGIELELKTVTPSVYFSSDVANPDTNTKFWADMEMYAWQPTVPDPARIMRLFVSWEAAAKANKWQGQNTARWRNDEYDAAYRAAEIELDPVKRAALFVRMNDIVCSDGHVIPLLHRQAVTGLAANLVAPLSGWDYDLGSLHDWHRA